MNTIKSLAFTLLAAAVVNVQAAEPRSILSRAGNSSFSVEVPEGWMVNNEESSIAGDTGAQLGTRMFDLVPSGSKVEGKYVYAPVFIKVVYYPNKTPITAQRYWEGLTYDGNVELPHAEGLPAWFMFGKLGRRDGKIGTAYYQLGSGTLVVDLTDKKGENYEKGEKALLALLRSFKDLGEAKRTP